MKRPIAKKKIFSLFGCCRGYCPSLLHSQQNSTNLRPYSALGILLLCFTLQPLLFYRYSSNILRAQAIESEIRNAIYYYRQAQEAYKIKDYRGAIELYRRALESNPRHAASYMGAAKTYTLLGIYKQAERSYRSLLEYLPRHQGARTGLAQVLIKTGKMQQAYKLLSAVQKEEPADTENNYSLGIWHLRGGNRRTSAALLPKDSRFGS